MKIDVPFVFHISFVPKGKRNTESVPARASTPVEIAEAKGALAFEIGCPYVNKPEYGHTTLSPFNAPPGETVRVYRAEDAYWVEICTLERAQDLIADRNAMPRDPFDVMLKLSERNYADAGSRDYKEDAFLSRAELEQKHTALRSWDESGRDRTAAILQRRAAEDIRAIDGRLCMRVSEPVLDIVHHSSPKRVTAPAPKPKRHRSRRYGRSSYRAYDPEPAPAPEPETPEGPADGYHLVISQVSRSTPSGFLPNWALDTHATQRWRIDQADAAVAFIRAEEALAHSADNDERAVESGTTIPPSPDRLLQPAAITVGFADTSACKHEGLSAILRREIDLLRNCLVQNVGALDKEMLAATLNLQHAFERSGGRLTPEVIALTRAAVDLHNAGHGPVALDYEVASAVRLRATSEYGERIEGALPGRVESIRFALSFWDRRDQMACEWTDRLLPVPVVPGTDFDVVELSTLQRGQDLVDVGCDPAVLDALAAVPKGDTHVVAAETLEGKLLGFAAAVRETASGLAVDRIFAPKAPNPRTLEQMRTRFDAFVAANIEVVAEHEALMGMTIG